MSETRATGPAVSAQARSGPEAAWPRWLKPTLLRRRLLELPTGRAIAFCRLALVLTSLLVVAIHPPAGEARQAMAIVLGLYLAFSLAVLVAPRLDAMRLAPHAMHGVDILATSALVFLTDGAASPFFTFFMFSLVVGLLRWNWRGALATAGLLAFVLLLLPSRFEVTPDGLRILDADLSSAIARGGFLLVCGSMLAYLGAHRERDRRRFAWLASWPAGAAQNGDDALDRALRHAAMVLQAPRVLLIYEEEEEPARHVVLWADGAATRAAIAPGLFGDLAGPCPGRVTLHNGRAHDDGDDYRLDRDLAQAYAISGAASVGFSRETCAGRVFLLDRPAWIAEDVPIVAIIGARLGIELEDRILHRRLEESVSARERMRLGRDLHDGLLQGLAAADIQLKLMTDAAPPQRRAGIIAARETLSTESRRIRAYVECARDGSPSATETAATLRAQARALADQWACAVDLTLDPTSLALQPDKLRHVGQILAEAASNAVRHAKATKLVMTIRLRADRLELVIADDGCGFAEPVDATAPRSLRGRVAELGGTLDVASSARGATLSIALPA